MTKAPEPPQEIRTRTSIYTRRADGIIVQRTLDGCVQSLEDARENVAAFCKLTIAPRHPLLIDMRKALALSPGVREYYAGPEAMASANAIAMLIESTGGRIIGNLYLALNRPVVPTRLFTSEPEAIAWLLKLDKALSASARKG